MFAIAGTNKSYGVRLAEDFLYAGSTALLIAIAHLYPDYWYISFLALVPFLWRVTRVTLWESLIVGCMLGTAYSTVISPLPFQTTGWSLFLKLIGFNVFFGTYAILVNRVKKHLGFQIVFIALLWLPIEYTVGHYYNLSSIFTFADSGSSLVIRVGSILGALMISFIVVIVNTIIYILLRKIIQVLLSHKSLTTAHRRLSVWVYSSIALIQRRYCFPDRRAPPGISDGKLI